MTAFVDSKGSTVRIGREIARGGEGIVYEIQGDSNHVAKVYFKDVSSEKAKKLFLMPGMATKELLSICSWPTEVLFEKSGGKLKGFIMPKIKGHEIHDLYSPASRKQVFPDADWRFLIQVARNLAAAVDTIHLHGHVIGDINQKGILVVKPQGVVRLIDCDSFQIQHNSSHFLCDVAVRDFTPPELQGRSLQGVLRTINHDNFGLAVLCFQLLFLGRHPFVGRYNVRRDIPLEEAIKEFLFVYSNTASRNLSPPPNALPLLAASSQVSNLFEKAFCKEAALYSGRPSAIEWVKTLEKLSSELRTCIQNKHHKYHASLDRCPWCSLEINVGPIFIEVNAEYSGTSSLNVKQLWQKIINIPTPGQAIIPTFNFSNIIGTPLPSAVTFAKYKSYGLRTLSLGLSGILIFNLDIFGEVWFFIIIGLIIMNIKAFKHEFDDGGETARRKNALSETKRKWDEIINLWNTEAGDSSFHSKFNHLKSIKEEYERLPKTYNEEKQKLIASREAYQKKHFLERYFIDKADISGIGRNLKSVLASYGIETANDIRRELQYKVPNFGPKRTKELLEWRRNIEAKFKFDPSKGVDPTDIAALDNRFKLLQKQLEENLENGFKELQQIRYTILKRRNGLSSHLEKAAYDLAKTTADAKLL